MKKFFKEHDLAKVALIVFVIAIVLTWIFPECYFSSGELVLTNAEKFGFMSLVDADYRLGLFDIVTYGFLSFYYFIDVFMFILMIGGFYKFIGSLKAYDALTTKLADVIKGKESIFVAITILLGAVLASIMINPIILLVFAPFILSILAKIKVDKVSGVATAFGGIFIGNLASVFSSTVAGTLINAGIVESYGFELVAVLVVGLIAYVLYTALILLRMKKVKNDKHVELTKDVFITEQETLKDKIIKKITKNGKVKKIIKKAPRVNTIPFVIVYALTAVILILAYLDWENVFGVTVFTDLYTTIQSATIGNIKLFFYLLGSVDLSGSYSFTAFGSWSLFSVIAVLMTSAFVLKIVYRKSFSDYIGEFGAGIAAIGHAFLPFMICYLVLEFSVLFVRIPGIIDWILGISTNFGTLYLSSLITSLFTVDFQYTVSLLSSVYSSFSNVNVAALALQFSYGLLSFFGPTSAILLFGLGLGNVKYSEWLKHIWKFVLAMLVVTLVVLAIIMYV